MCAIIALSPEGQEASGPACLLAQLRCSRCHTCQRAQQHVWRLSCERGVRSRKLTDKPEKKRVARSSPNQLSQPTIRPPRTTTWPPQCLFTWKAYEAHRRLNKLRKAPAELGLPGPCLKPVNPCEAARRRTRRRPPELLPPRGRSWWSARPATLSPRRFFVSGLRVQGLGWPERGVRPAVRLCRAGRAVRGRALFSPEFAGNVGCV